MLLAGNLVEFGGKDRKVALRNLAVTRLIQIIQTVQDKNALHVDILSYKRNKCEKSWSI